MPSLCALQSGVMRNQKTFYEKRRRQFGFLWHHSCSKDPNSEKLTREKVLLLCKWDGAIAAIGLETKKKKKRPNWAWVNRDFRWVSGSLGAQHRWVESCKHFEWPQASRSRADVGGDNSAAKHLFWAPGPDLSSILFARVVIISLLYWFFN